MLSCVTGSGPCVEGKGETLKIFYYFQAVFDIGVALILVGLNLLFEGDWGIVFIAYGLYLTITHGKLISDFMSVMEQQMKTKGNKNDRRSDRRRKDNH